MTVHVYTAANGKVADVVLSDRKGVELPQLGDDLEIPDSDFMKMPVDQLLAKYFKPVVHLIRDLSVMGKQNPAESDLLD